MHVHERGKYMQSESVLVWERNNVDYYVKLEEIKKKSLIRNFIFD
jgi:hypothetical protein